MVNTCKAWGHLWHGSTAPCPAPKINNCSISHPLASRRRWEIHLSYPKSSILATSWRLWETLSSPFQLSMCFHLAQRRLNSLHVPPEPHRVGWGVLRAWDMPWFSRKHQGYFKATEFIRGFFEGRSLLLSMVRLNRYSKCNESLEHCGPFYTIKSSASPWWAHLQCGITQPLDVLWIWVCSSSPQGLFFFLFFLVSQATDYK